MDIVDGLVITVLLALVGLSIWIAISAKPLGERRYRWGTFVGFQLAVNVIGASFLNYNLYPELRWFNLAISCCSGIASAGIFRRRKYGVVMFGATGLLSWVAALITTWQEPLGPLQATAGPLCYYAPTMIYFLKRWKLLGPDSPLPSSPPVGATAADSSPSEAIDPPAQ